MFGPEERFDRSFPDGQRLTVGFADAVAVTNSLTRIGKPLYA
jgi:hypothetical protein